MNSGPVIGGIIGHTKFHWDVWGDTVNVASRMESHGEAGKIQITRRLYEALHDEFDCQPRGLIEIKGKRPMETWFLLSEKT
jgi:guanylate cyclase